MQCNTINQTLITEGFYDYVLGYLGHSLFLGNSSILCERHERHERYERVKKVRIS